MTRCLQHSRLLAVFFAIFSSCTTPSNLPSDLVKAVDKKQLFADAESKDDLRGDYLVAASLDNDSIAFVSFNQTKACLEVALESAPGNLDFTPSCVYGEKKSHLGSFNAIAVEGDTLHIRSHNKTFDMPYYIQWQKGSAKTVMPVVNESDEYGIGGYGDIAVAPDGEIFISFYDTKKARLYLTRKASADPEFSDPEMVAPITGKILADEKDDIYGDAVDDYGLFSRIALTPDGRVHIAFYDARRHGLYIASGHKDEGVEDFTILQVDDNAKENGKIKDVGQYLDMEVDGDKLVLAYYDATYGDIVISEVQDSAVDTFVVESAGHVGMDPDLVVAGGKYHVVYNQISGDNRALNPRYAYGTKDNFSYQTLARAGAGGFFNALVLRDSGEIVAFDHLSFEPNPQADKQIHQKIRQFTLVE